MSRSSAPSQIRGLCDCGQLLLTLLFFSSAGFVLRFVRSPLHYKLRVTYCASLSEPRVLVTSVGLPSSSH